MKELVDALESGVAVAAVVGSRGAAVSAGRRALEAARALARAAARVKAARASAEVKAWTEARAAVDGASGAVKEEARGVRMAVEAARRDVVVELSAARIRFGKDAQALVEVVGDLADVIKLEVADKALGDVARLARAWKTRGDAFRAMNVPALAIVHCSQPPVKSAMSRDKWDSLVASLRMDVRKQASMKDEDLAREWSLGVSPDVCVARGELLLKEGFARSASLWFTAALLASKAAANHAASLGIAESALVRDTDAFFLEEAIEVCSAVLQKTPRPSQSDLARARFLRAKAFFKRESFACALADAHLLSQDSNSDAETRAKAEELARIAKTRLDDSIPLGELLDASAGVGVRVVQPSDPGPEGWLLGTLSTLEGLDVVPPQPQTPVELLISVDATISVRVRFSPDAQAILHPVRLHHRFDSALFARKEDALRFTPGQLNELVRDLNARIQRSIPRDPATPLTLADALLSPYPRDVLRLL